MNRPILFNNLNHDVCSIICNFIPKELYSILLFVSKQWYFYFKKQSNNLTDLILWCIRNNNVSLLKWLKKNYLFDHLNYIECSKITTEASICGRINILEWLLKQKCPIDYTDIYSTKYTSILEFLNNKSLIVNESINYCSTIETYNWLKINKQLNITSYGIHKIIQNNYEELFNYLYDQELIDYYFYTYEIITYDRLNMFKKFQKQDHYVYKLIVSCSSINFLSFIYNQNNNIWPDKLIKLAYNYKKSDVSKWLYYNNHAICRQMFYLAIMDNDIKFLDELYQKQPILDKKMWKFIDSVPMLEWLKEKNCPRRIERYKFFQPKEEVKQWLLNNNFKIKCYYE